MFCWCHSAICCGVQYATTSALSWLFLIYNLHAQTMSVALGLSMFTQLGSTMSQSPRCGSRNDITWKNMDLRTHPREGPPLSWPPTLVHNLYRNLSRKNAQMEIKYLRAAAAEPIPKDIYFFRLKKNCFINKSRRHEIYPESIIKHS